ncbi:glycoside hydrolase family 18 protein [Trichoderma virens Gv29-8]|uniref:chitinase n=2 Tax=Hypocrea virens TaxID=29875 RepID=G9MVN4_HYPVG|nr:glycoside hydrolase family 18 protein [Trichoderma virens Gv29-8]AAL84697.1 endochitinase class V precursor [Trichoderma virens]AFD36223.1 chitinase [Trichoderma virens]EHK21531.1 glycoside hydrolase family 18 protein [Trichoderma virens Gv29-8]
MLASKPLTMFKLLCVVLAVAARVAVANPATLSARCDDPKAHLSPLTEPVPTVPTADLPIDLPPIELEPISPEDIEEAGQPDPPSWLTEPSPVPVDSESPVLDFSPTSPQDPKPKLPGLNVPTNDGDDGHSSRKGYSESFRRKNVVYFTDWSIYGAGFLPQNLPADDITHLLYAFAGIAADGSVVVYDPWADEQKLLGKRNTQGESVHGAVEQVFLLKNKYRHMKTLLSIGGWTASQEGKFGPAISSPEGRRRFAETAVRLLADWGFDGLDVDYEYPANPQDAQNFVLLLQECRRALDEYAGRNGQNYHYLLTVATPAGPEHYSLLDMRAMDQYVDAWHLMAYDYAGSWDTVSGQQANLYPDLENPDSTKFNTDQAVGDYIARGIDPRKIVLGLPLYGRSFTNTDGLGRPYSGIGQGSIEPGVWLYRDLPRPGATVYVNSYTVSAYTYDPATRELVSYDNVETARLKAEYLQSRGLGGAVFWEAAGDRTGEESLIRTLAREMGHLDNSINMVHYPESRYTNIQNPSW